MESMLTENRIEFTDEIINLAKKHESNFKKFLADIKHQGEIIFVDEEDQLENNI